MHARMHTSLVPRPLSSPPLAGGRVGSGLRDYMHTAAREVTQLVLPYSIFKTLAMRVGAMRLYVLCVTLRTRAIVFVCVRVCVCTYVCCEVAPLL